MFPLWDAHRGDDLRGVHPTAETRAPTLNKSQRCATHCSDDLRSLHPTAKSISVVCITPQRQTAHRGDKINLSQVAFKGTICRNPFRGEHIYYERKNFKHKMLIY